MEHFLQHPWYYFKEYEIMELISGLLTVILTVFAMLWIDKRAAKRWMNEGYIKRKIELEIEIRKVLIEIKENIKKFPKIKQEDIDKKEYYEEFQSNLYWAIKDYKEKDEHFEKLILLIEEYKCFDKNFNYTEKLKPIDCCYTEEMKEGEIKNILLIDKYYDFNAKINTLLNKFKNIPQQ